MTLMTKDRVDALRELGLPLLASQTDIRAAWKRRAFETHPDRETGSEDDFARVRAAYDLLRRETSRPVSQVRRPSVEARIREISEDWKRACRTALETGEAPTVLWTSWLAALAHREALHVPSATRRRGRHVAYLVPTKLGKGTNRVAVPVGELEDPLRMKVKVLQFTSDRTGGGRIDVPEEVVAALFPGARSVELHFG